MSSYTHFTLEERKYLQQLLSEGYSMRKIAAALGRHPSSVSREIRRNRTKKYLRHKPDNPYWYHHWRAQALAKHRKRHCPHPQRTLLPGTFLYDYVREKLSLFWSPEQISHRLHQEYPHLKVGVSTIYRHLKGGAFLGLSPKKHLRRKGKRYQTRKANYNTIQPDRIIPEWPEEITQRLTLGHWEGDTVYGSIGKGLLVTLVDRKSRFLRAAVIQNRESTQTRLAIERLLQSYPVRSISLDNGSEFSEFHLLEENLHTLVYFAQPHKPWQRGTNENTNGILRFFFPKGYHFHSLSQDDLQSIVDLINNRPRKCLGWKSPAEVFYQGVALA